MTVLAGFWHFADQTSSRLARVASDIIDAQLGEPDFPKRMAASGGAALGQALIGAVSGGRQGVDDGDVDGMLIAIDARVDNRAELFDKLQCARDDAVDDDSLLRLAHRRWGEKLVDHVLGDFAIVAWDPREQIITLFRDPTGQRPLHYYVGDGFVAVASTPDGLFAIDGVRREVNPAQLSRFVADLPLNGPDTFFRGVKRVEPAHVVRIDRSRTQTRRYWDMPAGELRYRRDEDYVEAFREQLDRATRVRLRGSEQLVAAHLSAGLDSGSVASTAARLLTPLGGKVLAITSAPRVGFDGPVPLGRIGDESDIAATLAARYPNMEHVVLRSTGVSPLDMLAGDSRLFAQPVGLPCNNVWWSAANEAARARGANVMLTGEMGNLTISAGGLSVLPEFVRAGRLLAWLREMKALEKGEPRWRGLLAASLAPWLPGRLWTMLTRFSAGGPAASSGTLLTDAANALAASGGTQSIAPRWNHRERDTRWALLKSADSGNFRKSAFLRWGIDERDPTADRRLVEFCFSLPPSQLIGRGQTRRLARAALADRLPGEVLNGPRGYQFADWYETLDGPGLARFAARVAADPVAAAVIDFAAVDRLIARWPAGDWGSAATIGTYRIGLLRALSAGAFALNAGK